MASFDASVKLEIETCSVCGTAYAFATKPFRQRDKVTFYCPNGHAQSYVQTTEDIQRKEIEELKWKLERAEKSAADAIEARRCHFNRAQRLEKRLKKLGSLGVGARKGKQ